MNYEKALATFLKDHVPLSQFMGVSIAEYTDTRLLLEAPLEPNINDKGTGFGGSIYVMAVMSCWGTVYLKSLEHGLAKPNIVIAHGEMKYQKPVTGVLRACCELDGPETFADFFAFYEKKGRASIKLKSKVLDADGNVLAKYDGKYAILGD